MTEDDSSNAKFDPRKSLGIFLTTGFVIMVGMYGVSFMFCDHRDKKDRLRYNFAYETALKKADLNKDGILQSDEKRKWYSDMGIERILDGTEPKPTIGQLEDYNPRKD